MKTRSPASLLGVLVVTKVLRGARRRKLTNRKLPKALLKPAHRIDRQKSHWIGGSAQNGEGRYGRRYTATYLLS